MNLRATRFPTINCHSSIQFHRTFLPFYPLANSGSFTFVGTQVLTGSTDQFGIRVDHYLTERDVLNFRYSFRATQPGRSAFHRRSERAGISGGGRSARPEFRGSGDAHIYTLGAGDAAGFPICEINFYWTRHLNHTDPASLGFEYAPTLDAASGPPFIQIGGYASVGDPITGPRKYLPEHLRLFDFSNLGERPPSVQIRRRLPVRPE